MLHLQRSSGQYSDHHVPRLPRPAAPRRSRRLQQHSRFSRPALGRREGVRAQAISPSNPAARDFLHGRVEVLLTRQLSTDPNDWECLVRPGRKIGVGERLFFGEQANCKPRFWPARNSANATSAFSPPTSRIKIRIRIKTSSQLSIASATSRSRPISRARILPEIASAIKPSMPITVDQ